MQTRDYDYIKIPALMFMNQDKVSDQEVDSYYQQHQKDFLSPEKVSVEYIRLSMSDIKSKIKTSEAEIKRYYDENQSNYYTPTQWKVAHILFAVPDNTSADEQQRIKERAEETYRSLVTNPLQFDQDVKTISDDKISAIHGGVLPWIIAGQSEFDKALVNLTTPGQVSAPVKSSHGYEIFKLISYKPAKIKPLINVKAEIQEQILADIAQAKYTQALEQLSDLSYQTPDSLAPVAKALQLTVEESTPFSQKGGDTELTKNKQILNAAFSHDVLVLANNSEPVQLDNDSVIVLRVKNHLPAMAKTLAQVKPMIIKKLSMMKAKVEASQLGKEVLGASKTPLEQDKLIKDNHLQWQVVKNGARESDATQVAINEMAFNLPRLGANVGRSLVGGDYVIVQLKKINDGQLASLDKEQVASITQQIEANYGMMDYDLYVSNLMSKATIVKH